MHIRIGPLSVTIKYTYPRHQANHQTTIYQRSVPTDLRGRYPSPTIKQDLKTADPVMVARMVADLNRKLEAEWAGLRASPESSPVALEVHADALLRQWGLRPHTSDNDPRAIDLLHDHMDSKRQRYAGGDEEAYREADSSDYLSPVEMEAGRRLHGTKTTTLSSALELHLSLHPQRDSLKFSTYQRRAFASLTAVVGDKPIEAFTRADARKYLDTSQLTKVKTATIRRRLGVMRSVFSTYLKENDLTRANPFAELAIKGEGQDKKSRIPFTSAELTTLDTACRAKDDDLRWILALLADTGARLAEVVGLTLSDIVMDAQVPHVVIQPHPWRSLKNTGSRRMVPLVGSSLWAAGRVQARAVTGQMFAFPRYTTDADCKASSASAALASWIRRIPLDHTAHDLRHAMADRLRAVQCPKEIRYAIDGHAAQDVGDTYGEGFSLKVKAEWLLKVTSAGR